MFELRAEGERAKLCGAVKRGLSGRQGSREPQSAGVGLTVPFAACRFICIEQVRVDRPNKPDVGDQVNRSRIAAADRSDVEISFEHWLASFVCCDDVNIRILYFGVNNKLDTYII
jgi:hypothetical protein